MPVDEILAEARVSHSGAVEMSSLLQGTSGQIQWPIEIQFAGLLDKDEGSYVAHSSELEQFGYGATPGDALDDFGKTISEMYFYLSDAVKSDSLGESLKEHYRTLSTLLALRDRQVKVA
jgi:hypothetical protein